MPLHCFTQFSGGAVAFPIGASLLWPYVRHVVVRTQNALSSSNFTNLRSPMGTSVRFHSLRLERLNCRRCFHEFDEGVGSLRIARICCDAGGETDAFLQWRRQRTKQLQSLINRNFRNETDDQISLAFSHVLLRTACFALND